MLAALKSKHWMSATGVSTSSSHHLPWSASYGSRFQSSKGTIEPTWH